MIGWRDPGMVWTQRATLCDTGAMNPLTQASAVIAGATARRVLTDSRGRIVVSRTSTHLLARRALISWWDLR